MENYELENTERSEILQKENLLLYTIFLTIKDGIFTQWVQFANLSRKIFPKLNKMSFYLHSMTGLTILRTTILDNYKIKSIP